MDSKREPETCDEVEVMEEVVEICVFDQGGTFLVSTPHSSAGLSVMSKNIKCFINGHMVALFTPTTFQFYFGPPNLSGNFTEMC